MSFVVVRYSDEYEHNFGASSCASHAGNQLILVDNPANLQYPTLGLALNEGLEQAVHELIVIAHEDVFLPDGWQAQFERSIAALEAFDPHWRVAAAAGLDARGVAVGHVSSPWRYENSFTSERPFVATTGIDDHFIVLRRSQGMRFDDAIPGIHGIGMDLVLTAMRDNARCYVIDAATVHKYRDRSGNVIKHADGSDKIQARGSIVFKAAKSACDDYLRRKWDSQTPFRSRATRYDRWCSPADEIEGISSRVRDHLDHPVILLGKGGGGSRLLSVLAQDVGVFLGKTNASGDTLDLAAAVYQGIVEKAASDSPAHRALIVDRLRLAAARMLEPCEEQRLSAWGFKLPESLLLLPELSQAFPQATYIQLFRHPECTCLRRTHMTARLDNLIGQIALRDAYLVSGHPVAEILVDPPAIRMARTTVHQVGLGLDFFRRDEESERRLSLRFEDVLSTPREALDRMARFVRRAPVSSVIAEIVDSRRAATPDHPYSVETEQRVAEIVGALTRALGYDNPGNLLI